MSKFYSLTFALLGLSALSAGAVVPPYSSAIGDKAAGGIASDWTIIDSNIDKTTWEWDNTDDKLTAVTGYNCGIKYRYSASKQADDWAFSPEFELKEGVEYVFSYWIKESKEGKEALEVFIGSSKNPADYKSSDAVKSYNKNIGASWKHEKLSFSPTSDGTYHIGFHCTSEKNQWGVFLRGFSIKANVLMPGAPQNLAVAPAADKTLSATLTWTLPANDDDGNPLQKDITSVIVKRNGEKIAEIDGAATEYVDTSLPEPGIYEYEVSATIDGVEGMSCKVTSNWIGMKTPQALPYSENFKNPDFFKTFWSTIDVAGDAKANSNSSYPPLSNAWCFQSNLMGNAWWAVLYSSRNAEVTDDDWLISAPLAFPAAGKYKVSFKLSMYAGQEQGCKLGVYAGTGETAEDFNIEIGEITSVASTQLNPNDGGTPFEFEFEAPAAGVYYIGFHSTNKASTVERRLQFGAFNVEVVELYGDAVIVPPYDSAEDTAWAEAKTLTFALDKGYYHASWIADGPVAVDVESVGIDSEFDEEFAVVKVPEAGNVAFSAENVFSAFSIIPADHTPAAVESVTYNVNGANIIFKFKAPEFNLAGNPLYEVEGARIYADGELLLEEDGFTPGQEKILTANAPLTRAAEPVYTVAFHNLSGEAAPVEAVKDNDLTTGVKDIIGGADSAPARIYTLDGTELSSSDDLRAGIYVELKGGKARKIIVR